MIIRKRGGLTLTDTVTSATRRFQDTPLTSTGMDSTRAMNARFAAAVMDTVIAIGGE
jgi:hypothetical protein